MSLNVNTVVVAKSEPYSCELEGETIVLEPVSRHYFGMNEVASFVWKQIQSEMLVSDIVARVCSHFEVEPELCLSDILLFLEELNRRKLLRVLSNA